MKQQELDLSSARKIIATWPSWKQELVVPSTEKANVKKSNMIECAHSHYVRTTMAEAMCPICMYDEIERLKMQLTAVREAIKNVDEIAAKNH